MLHQLGLDRPLVVQYGDYVWNVLHGNLGTSLVTHDSVLGEFLTFFPATVELALSAMLIAVLVGMPAGIVAAVRRGTHDRLHGDGHCRSPAIRCRSSGGGSC